MIDINEKLLQFIWQHKLFKQPLYTVDNKLVTLLFAGNLNNGDGPDFLETKLNIDNITLVGNVEIDNKTSLWKAHHHNTNNNYKNVIVHVVWQHDLIENLPHQHIPVIELQGFVSKILLQQYQTLMESKTLILCNRLIESHNFSPLVLQSFLDKLLVERLSDKTERINLLLQQSEQNWEQVFFILLMKNFGYSVNEKCFEEIAINTDIRIFAKNKHNENAIYSILMGQANLLHKNFLEDVPKNWYKEYEYLAQKYSLKPIQQALQFGKMFPANFPAIRLAQMAALIFKSQHLFSKIIAAKTLKEVYAFFDINVHAYFDNHYVLDKTSEKIFNKKIGKQFIENIVINTVFPAMFIYGKTYKDKNLIDKVFAWLEDIPAEKNSIVNLFKVFPFKLKKASDSQAIVQLFKNYCRPQKCLKCTIAYELLK